MSTDEENGLHHPTSTTSEEENGSTPHNDDKSFLPVVRHLSIDENSPLLGTHHPRSQQQQQSSSLQSCRGPKQFWKWYEAKIDSDPILTKSVTSAILVGGGDFIGQCIEIASHASQGIDCWRSARFTSMGFLLYAPITHYYYLWLDRKLPPTPSPWTPTTFLKLAIDQLTFAPIFTVFVFLYLGVLEGSSWGQISDKIHAEFWSTMIANWKLWCPAVFVNLAFCPPEFRVLYNNVVFFVWSIILSLLLNATKSQTHVVVGTTTHHS